MTDNVNPEQGDWADPALSEWWQQEFTDGVDPEYTDQILPLIAAELHGAHRILDIGAGEGQVARRLRGISTDGPFVVGVDPFVAQIDAAAERGGGVHYGLAGAAGLPFADETFDGAVACLVFEHINEVDLAIHEVARVLEPGGRFLFLLNHPLLQTPNSGWIDDQIIEPPEQYWRIGAYLVEQSTIEEVQKDVFVRFIHRPLSRYLNALFAAGLVLEHMHEPAPPEAFLAQAPQYLEAATVPRLLALRLRKPS